MDMDATPFPYEGPAAWSEPIATALRQVVDPEIGLSIVDLGLVYGVEAGEGHCDMQLTMTSAACPLGDLIVADARTALEGVLPEGTEIDIVLVWDPPWTPDRMSDGARQRLGW